MSNIDYNIPYQRLNISTENAINKNFDVNKFYRNSEFNGKPVGIWDIGPDKLENFLDAEWLESLHQKGLPINRTLIFYRDSYYIHPEAHVDVHRSGTICNFALNWVFSDNDDSYMTWYDVPLETGQEDITPADTRYVYWPLDEVKDKESARLTIGNQLTLVDVSKPHNVVVNKNPRWVMTLRIADPSWKTLSWRESVDKFNELGFLL